MLDDDPRPTVWRSANGASGLRSEMILSVDYSHFSQKILVGAIFWEYSIAIEYHPSERFGPPLVAREDGWRRGARF
jgi:hypothetical protein